MNVIKSSVSSKARLGNIQGKSLSLLRRWKVCHVSAATEGVHMWTPHRVIYQRTPHVTKTYHTVTQHTRLYS